MAWLFEDPTIVLTVGAAVEVVLAIVLMRTGRAVVILAMVGVAAVVGAVVLVERFVVTEREEIETELYAVAATLEANDFAATSAHFAPSARSLLEQARGHLSRSTVREVRIRDLKIKINRLASPPLATADFWCAIKGDSREMNVNDATYPAQVTVEFHRIGDRWLISAANYRYGLNGGGGNTE